MNEYVEDSSNTIFQIFNEFSQFLNCIIYYNIINDKSVKNITLTAMRLHMRAIIGFFQNEAKNKNDLIYSDLIDTEKDLSITMSDDMRKFINKATAHISKKRGKLNYDNHEFFQLMKAIIFSIDNFVEICDTSLVTKYQNDYQEKDVVYLKKIIEKRIEQDTVILKYFG